MTIIVDLINVILHIDVFLSDFIAMYGWLTYLILFLIIFCETGLVVMPFLPGDSILFAAGALCAATGQLNLYLLLILLILAAISGDTLNYFLGSRFRHILDDPNRLKFIKRKHLDQTTAFFEKNGGKTIFLARFLPIIRTFAPFIAGGSDMNYRHFLNYNIIGGITWVSLFTLAGYFFGEVPFVQENFSLIIIAVIAISVVPILVFKIRDIYKKRKEKP